MQPSPAKLYGLGFQESDEDTFSAKVDARVCQETLSVLNLGGGGQN